MKNYFYSNLSALNTDLNYAVDAADSLTAYAPTSSLTAYATTESLTAYAQLSDLNNISVDMTPCLSAAEFNTTPYLAVNAFGEANINEISNVDIINKINLLIKLLKRDPNTPSGGDPTKTYVKYTDGTISELTISGALASSSIPNKTDAVNVKVGNTVTKLGNSAFYGCRELISITIPSSVTSIDNYVFQDCSSLTSIVIPSSVTSIGDSVFIYSGLLTITIPSSVTSIGSKIFMGTTATATFEGRTMAEVQAMNNYSWRLPTGQGKIICTDGTL